MIRGSLVLGSMLVFSTLVAGCGGSSVAPSVKEVQRARAGDLDVVVLSASGALKQGKDTFVLEFRSRSDQKLVAVGTVKVSATMVMAGMPPMIGNTTVTQAGMPGRYDVATDVNMAGSWRLGLEWDGPAGKGSTTFQGQFQ